MTEEEKQEFDEYTTNHFEGLEEIAAQDEDYLEPWEEILQNAEEYGAADTVNSLVCPKRPVNFRSPETVSVSIEESFGGKIPVIKAGNAADFEDLVTNIAYKGERPDNIETTGASFIFGKTTRMIILSYKPYSNVPATDLGLLEDEWAEKSMKLRFGHECTHFFTKRTYGIAKNLLHDEIMADFTGMYEAFGFYRAEWFLRFMGLVGENGKRLVFYTSGLSVNVKDAVSDLLTRAAYGLERWSLTEECASLTAAERIKLMCREGLSGLPDL